MNTVSTTRLVQFVYDINVVAFYYPVRGYGGSIQSTWEEQRRLVGRCATSVQVSELLMSEVVAIDAAAASPAVRWVSRDA